MVEMLASLPLLLSSNKAQPLDISCRQSKDGPSTAAKSGFLDQAQAPVSKLAQSWAKVVRPAATQQSSSAWRDLLPVRWPCRTKEPPQTIGPNDSAREPGGRRPRRTAGPG